MTITTKEQRDAWRRSASSYVDDCAQSGLPSTQAQRMIALLDHIDALESEPCSQCGHRMGKAKCGHNDYWTTHFGNCMACQRQDAEKERDGLRDQVEMIKNQRDGWQSRCMASEAERDHARAKVAELREALHAISDADYRGKPMFMRRDSVSRPERQPMNHDEVREIMRVRLMQSHYSYESNTFVDDANHIIAALESAGFLIVRREEQEAKWIACADQKPPDETFILATGPRCRASNQPNDPCMMVMWYDGHDWWDTNDDFELFCDNITHWMPLPSGPASVRARE